MKENLKPCVYKQSEGVKARRRTFCRTVRRVIVRSEVKYSRYGAEAKASLKRAAKLRVIDPKPGDLPMDRLKPE